MMLYRDLVGLNGRGQNARLRRLSDVELAELRAYAETQPALPFASTNEVAWKARKEQDRRERA